MTNTKSTDNNTLTSASSPIFALGGDLPVHRIGYGAMRLTDAPDARSGITAPVWGPVTDRADSVALLRRAVELGVDLFDTADAYALGSNEELLAEALAPFRDRVTIATKVGVVRPAPFEWVTHGHPAYLRQQAELSLRRLRTERIDLLYLHRIDPAYPLADQVGALKQLQEEGKVRHIGLSEVTVAELTAAEEVAPVAAVQNVFNLAARQHEDVVDHTAARGIAFLPYHPVAMGAHTAADSPVAAVAKELDATAAQVALAWQLHRAPNVVPLPGTSSPAHLAENVRARELPLSEAQFARISGLEVDPDWV
ncbi:aldo/keto reductase [Streptomyces sp. NPDC087440]|uniref:aldo/keto reductase n=1 Tax=Streptomyces sp. NPDC087440 TaxID=3365790 RepID=UPI00380AD863